MPGKEPFLSIVVIGRNEAANLGRLFSSLPALAGMELLYVDSGSTDGSPALARVAGARVLLVAPDSIYAPGTGRHVGTLEARGSWILYLDGDMVLAPEFVPLLERLGRPDSAPPGKVAGLVGRTLNRYLDGEGREVARRDYAVIPPRECCPPANWWRLPPASPVTPQSAASPEGSATPQSPAAYKIPSIPDGPATPHSSAKPRSPAVPQSPADSVGNLPPADWGRPVRYHGGAVLYRRAAVLAAGNWNPAVYQLEEVDLCCRVRAGGGEIRALDLPMVEHYTPYLTARERLALNFRARQGERFLCGAGQVVTARFRAGTLLSFVRCYPYPFAVAAGLVLAPFLYFIYPPLPFIVNLALALWLGAIKRWYFYLVYLGNLLQILRGLGRYRPFTPRYGPWEKDSRPGGANSVSRR